MTIAFASIVENDESASRARSVLPTASPTTFASLLPPGMSFATVRKYER
jgi:hypothetical protein